MDGFGFYIIWTASSEFGTYRLCEQRRFRRACASAQSRQNLRCSLIQALSQEEPSDRKPDPWPLWMAGHAQLKFVMTECSKTQIRLTGLICSTLRKYPGLLIYLINWATSWENLLCHMRKSKAQISLHIHLLNPHYVYLIILSSANIINKSVGSETKQLMCS